MIRKTQNDDIKEILRIYDNARLFMRQHGNNSQWADGYPNHESLIMDMKNEASYVVVENGVILGTFAFYIGVEETYNKIYDGAWKDDSPYGYIHRIASSGIIKNFTKLAFDYGVSQIHHLRIDTHRDNEPMQNALKRYGFTYCGIIYLQSGDERMAFEYT